MQKKHYDSTDIRAKPPAQHRIPVLGVPVPGLLMVLPERPDRVKSLPQTDPHAGDFSGTHVGPSDTDRYRAMPEMTA